MDPSDRPHPRRPRSFGCRRVIPAVLVALSLGASPAALAQAPDPFTPLPSQPSSTATTSTSAATSTSSSGGSLSGTEQAGLVAAGILLIVGIAFLIRRDAHHRAPVAARATGDGQRGSVRPRAMRVEQSRAKAKAARRQRKRTR